MVFAAAGALVGLGLLDGVQPTRSLLRDIHLQSFCLGCRQSHA